jgi:hypothetical protein
MSIGESSRAFADELPHRVCAAIEMSARQFIRGSGTHEWREQGGTASVNEELRAWGSILHRTRGRQALVEFPTDTDAKYAGGLLQPAG